MHQLLEKQQTVIILANCGTFPMYTTAPQSTLKRLVGLMCFDNDQGPPLNQEAKCNYNKYKKPQTDSYTEQGNKAPNYTVHIHLLIMWLLCVLYVAFFPLSFCRVYVSSVHAKSNSVAQSCIQSETDSTPSRGIITWYTHPCLQLTPSSTAAAAALTTAELLLHHSRYGLLRHSQFISFQEERTSFSAVSRRPVPASSQLLVSSRRSESETDQSLAEAKAGHLAG